MKSRTLLQLGLTLMVGSLSGCILETTSSPAPGYTPGPGPACPDGQYFLVRWEVDNGTGTTPLGCSQTPPSHIEATLNTAPPSLLDIAVQSCDDRQFYNFSGASETQIPVGTAVTSVSLISESSGSAGSVLSTAPVPPNLQNPIQPCSYSLLTFQFPLN